MKGAVLLCAAIAAVVLFSAGCSSPRFHKSTTLAVSDVSEDVSGMDLATAKRIIDHSFANIPAGRQAKNPGYEYIGKNARSIVLRDHSRTGYCLVEVKSDARAFLKFYQLDRQHAVRFGNAVKRLSLEYQK